MVSLGRHISLWNKEERSKALSRSRPIFTSSFFDVKILEKQDTIARLIVVVPKKVGSAPYRNLLKRRARSIFYQEKLYLSGYDWVIFFKPSSPLSYEYLHEKLVTLCKSRG